MQRHHTDATTTVRRHKAITKHRMKKPQRRRGAEIGPVDGGRPAFLEMGIESEIQEEPVRRRRGELLIQVLVANAAFDTST